MQKNEFEPSLIESVSVFYELSGGLTDWMFVWND